MYTRPAATVAIVLAISALFIIGLERAPRAAATREPTLVRGPYFGVPATDLMQIRWVTDTPADSVVRYGIGSVALEASSPVVSTTHVVTLTGLQAGTLYSFSIQSSGIITPLAESTFRTLRSDADPFFTFAVLGDSGVGDAHQYAVAGTLQRIQPDFVLHTGDVIYPAGEAAYYDTRFFAPYSRTLATTPFFMSPGNHDYLQPGAAPYFGNFYLPANNPAGTEGYYSVDYGNAHIVSLDTDGSGTVSAAMTSWLAQDLAATTRFWKFVFFHHAIYTSGPHGGDAYVLPLRNTLAPIFEQYNVDVVFNGHDHTYERSTPRKDYVPSSRGVTYIVTGGGGAPLYAQTSQNPWSAAFYSVDDYWHAVRVGIANCRLTLSAVQAPSDTIFDTLSLDRCRYLRVPLIFNSPGGPTP